jgi:secondary thiamine-phosphate synthase enzyme
MTPAATGTTTKGRTTCPHIRAALTAVSLTIPLIDGRLSLGTWQGVFLFEHRTRGHQREVALHLIGE